MQEMMDAVMKMMGGGDNEGVSFVIGGDGGRAGTGLVGDGAMQLIHGENLQEILMGAQRQQEGVGNQQNQDSPAVTSRSKQHKKNKKSKTPIDSTEEEESKNKKKNQRSCWVEDRSGMHMCKTDSDCGIDGHSCKQRVCSQYGYCADPN